MTVLSLSIVPEMWQSFYSFKFKAQVFNIYEVAMYWNRAYHLDQWFVPTWCVQWMPTILWFTYTSPWSWGDGWSRWWIWMRSTFLHLVSKICDKSSFDASDVTTSLQPARYLEQEIQKLEDSGKPIKAKIIQFTAIFLQQLLSWHSYPWKWRTTFLGKQWQSESRDIKLKKPK